ncbi:hypothetical protein CK203_105227 [Vitis vinifera]|uniref:Uncharacterized protein n=1 Tax=Vitis vinifera TaxID=29760 RepID=A0A438C5D8_VITVI|nr:hypothetical protein CK203_105227 [Vitis vinifera]
MMTADRATCIVFSDDDLPPEDSNHTRLYILQLVVQVTEFHLSIGQWLGLERLPISYCYHPWSCTCRLWSLYIDGQSNMTILKGSHGYFDDRVVDWSDYIPHTIPSFEDSHVITVQSLKDMFTSSEPVLQINHNFIAMSFGHHSSTVVLNMMRDGVDELQHQFHYLQLGDETFGAPISVMIASSSPNRANFLSLCFLEETTNCGVDVEPIGVTNGVVP